MLLLYFSVVLYCLLLVHSFYFSCACFISCHRQIILFLFSTRDFVLYFLALDRGCSKKNHNNLCFHTPPQISFRPLLKQTCGTTVRYHNILVKSLNLDLKYHAYVLLFTEKCVLLYIIKHSLTCIVEKCFG